MSKQFYWFAGDRFLATTRKQKIVQEIMSGKKDWSIKDLSSFSTIDAFASQIASKDLFGSSNIIYTYDGDLPEPKVAAKVIKGLNKNHKFILITPNAKKNTKFYKELGKNVELFEPMKDGNRVNSRRLPRAKSFISNFVNWEGDSSIIDYVVEMSDYDYGTCVSEIQKIRLYTGKKDKDIRKEACKPIVCNSDKEDLDKLIYSINFRRAYDVFETWAKLRDIHHIYAPFHLLLENFYFMLYCRMAYDSGERRANDIGKYVSEYWHKKSGPVSSSSIAFRYRLNEPAIKARSFEEILEVISEIEKTIYATRFEKVDTNLAVEKLLVSCLGKPILK